MNDVTSKREILDCLREAVVKGSEEEVELWSRRGLEAGLQPMELLDEGMAPGIREVGLKFDRGECFLPELMMAGEAMKAGLRVVLPKITPAAREGTVKRKGKILLGSVEGDVHDIGKNIVGAMLIADGFEVVDLGVDVPAWTFIERVKVERPVILGVGSYMSTTLNEQRKIAEALKQTGLRGGLKYIVGGVACTREWAEQIGADGYARDAAEAVELCRRLMGSERKGR